MGKQKHTVEVVKTDLEINEELELHEKGWKIQRLGWIFIFLIVALGLFGFFGDGLASKTTVTQNQAKIQYDKFYRREARMEMKVDLLNNTNTPVDISFPNNYLKNFQLESILPEPASIKVGNEQVHYLFDGQGSMNIVFYLIPKKTGNIPGFIRMNENDIPISHFIYP